MLSDEVRETSVDALDGKLVWSTFDRTARRFRLVELDRRSGAVRRLPVASRGVAFDVDLGRDAGGRVVAVYSRCRREPRTHLPLVVKVDLTSGDGCRLRRFDFGTRRERELRAPVRRGRSAFLPTLWRGRLVWHESAGSRRSFRPTTLLSGTLRSRTRTQVRRIPAGHVPTDVDLRGRRVATATLKFGTSCADGTGEPGTIEGLVDVALRIVDVDGSGHRLVEQGCDGDETRYLYAPAFTSAGDLFYFLDRAGDSPLVDGTPVRSAARLWNAATGRYREAEGGPPGAISAAQEGGRIAWVESVPDAGYRVMEDAAPAYRDAIAAKRVRRPR